MTFSTSPEWRAWLDATFAAREPDAKTNLVPGIHLARAEHFAGTPHTCTHGLTMGVSCVPCGRSVTS